MCVLLLVSCEVVKFVPLKLASSPAFVRDPHHELSLFDRAGQISKHNAQI